MALATSYRTRLPLQRYDDRQWIEIGNTGYPYYEMDGRTMLSGISLMGWFATASSIAMVTPPPGKGSAYIWSYHGSNGEWLDGSRTYREWLLAAYGRTFAETFPMEYGRKYHTAEAGQMTTDWLGPRLCLGMLSPSRNR